MIVPLVSSVIQLLGMVIQKEIEQEVRLVVGVKKDINKLSHSLTKILAVLKDAEERQITEKPVRLWLQDLKDLAYDIDDVLDEWSTEILKSQITEVDGIRISPTKKVLPINLFSPCFCFRQIGLRRDIGHRIIELKERLDEIANEKDKFHFAENPRNEVIDESRRRLETSSFVDVSEVFGREMDKNEIIEMLLSESNQQGVVSGVPIISIVAMPGIGKTTLAQLIFNDDMVKNHFNKRMWIHVSKSFDKVKVAMHIIREIGGNIVHQGDHDITWQAVHHQLTSFVDGKHFLLVLDDVWNENPEEWDPLRRSLKYGSQGSRIIVTTRNEKVAVMMGTTYFHRLGGLPDEACWSLLRHYAFVGRQKDECEKLKAIGIKLAKKCNGLPLSTKTLGSLLRFKKSNQDWQYVLESDVWRVVSSVDKSVLPALLLSFYDLPSNLKQCFAYCSLYPRSYFINKWSIIQQWMAQGFLNDSLAASSEDLDIVGDEYFNNLIMRSFLQEVDKDSKGRIEFCEMHDLIHDFAKYLVENECLTLMIKDTNAQEFNFSRARHLYLLIEEISVIPSFVYKAKNLRTLKIYGHIPKVSSELFRELTCLRTLDLGNTYLEELPSEIEKLIHLRYLNLSQARFKELPETLTRLYNLQVLQLYACRNLYELPEGIGGLVNLIDLGLLECRQLSHLPEGIGKLTRLRGLSDFIIGGVERGGCKIGELKNLNFLKGSLRIISLERVKNGNEAKMACLKDKQYLRALYLYFNHYTGVSRADEDVVDEEGEEGEEEEEDDDVDDGDDDDDDDDNDDDTLSKRMEDVLESLQPHPNLEKLIMRDYPGAMFPNWMGSHAEFIIFSNLIFLELRGCRRCKQLPSTLGKLPFLETLVIAEMYKVKFMGVEFFAVDDTIRSDNGVDTIFPKLKVFQLDGMWNLKEWDMRVQEKYGKEFSFMPCLEYLSLIVLPKLRSFPQHLSQSLSLKKLFIWYCPKLNWMPSPSSHLPFLHVEELILKWDAGSFSKSLVANNHMFLPKLRLLRVRKSPYSLLPEGLGNLTSLETLDIRTCSKIKSIPGKELSHITTLKELTIMRCPALRRRCQKDIGEDWSKIFHIPKIFIDGDMIKQGTASAITGRGGKKSDQDTTHHILKNDQENPTSSTPPSGISTYPIRSSPKLKLRVQHLPFDERNREIGKMWG